MSILKVDTIQEKTSGNGVVIPSGQTLYAPGHVVQVLQANKTDAHTASLTSTWTGITGLSVTITPSSASSKILIMPSVFLGANFAVFYHFRLHRNGANITEAMGDAAGSRSRNYAMMYLSVNTNNNSHTMTLPPYLDSPATTGSTTYQLYMSDPQNSGSTVFINRSNRDSNSSFEPRAISTLTAMEIAQ